MATIVARVVSQTLAMSSGSLLSTTMSSPPSARTVAPTCASATLGTTPAATMFAAASGSWAVEHVIADPEAVHRRGDGA